MHIDAIKDANKLHTYYVWVSSFILFLLMISRQFVVLSKFEQPRTSYFTDQSNLIDLKRLEKIFYIFVMLCISLYSIKPTPVPWFRIQILC